jgi:hypothetical protein
MDMAFAADACPMQRALALIDVKVNKKMLFKNCETTLERNEFECLL